MISAQAAQGMEAIFHSAVKSRLTMQPSDPCTIEPAGLDDFTRADRKIVVLTISSIQFRLLLVFHVKEDACTRDYFAGASGKKDFIDSFFEIANLCCGAVNKELVRYFPDMGMSTPYLLEGSCADHLAALKPAYLSHYAITMNDNVRLHATVCLCAHGPVHFVADMSAVEDDSGALELF